MDPPQPHRVQPSAAEDGSAQASPAPGAANDGPTQAPTPVAGDDEEDDSVTDARRNWSNDVTLKLVKVWKRVCEEHPNAGRVARMQLLYDEFKDAVDCSNRSLKAVEDKLYTVKQMYRFIAKMNGTILQQQQHQQQHHESPHDPQTNIPTWFMLTKDERRAVRLLHRIRVPNISLDVFTVLDSVLNPTVAPPLSTPSGTPQALEQQQQQQQEQEQANHHVDSEQRVEPSIPDSESSSDSNRENKSDVKAKKDSEKSDVIDGKRNWSHPVTLQLAKAWRNVIQADADLRGVMLSQRVYKEFMSVVGGSSRSRKAVDDKMHSIREMYRFISTYNAGCVPGSGKPLWFELNKPDRRHLKTLHKIRVPNLAQDVYTELDAFMKTTVLDSLVPSAVPMTNLHQVNVLLPPGYAPSLTPAASATESGVHGSSYNRFAGSVLANSCEILRRLANEESQVSLAPLHATASQSQLPVCQQPQQQQQLQPPQLHPVPIAYPTTTTVHQEQHGGEQEQDPNQQIQNEQPPAKRFRSNAETSNEQRLQQLLALQGQAIVERRQHHAEQMAVLGKIVGLLQNQAQDFGPHPSHS